MIIGLYPPPKFSGATPGGETNLLILSIDSRKDGLNNIRTCLTSATRSKSFKAAVCTELGQPLQVKDMPSKEQLAKNEVTCKILKIELISICMIVIFKYILSPIAVRTLENFGLCNVQ